MSFGSNLKFISIPQTSYQEIGFGFNMRYAPSRGNLGLRFNVEPSFATEGSTSIWDVNNNYNLTRLIDDAYKLQLNSSVSYGIGVERAIVVPFSEYNLTRDKFDYSLGVIYYKLIAPN